MMLTLVLALSLAAQEIHQTLREQIKLIPPALPFEGHSYDAKMDFEITKMQTHSVRARLGRLLAHIEQQQLAFQQQATTTSNV
jgi:hypothetical protein